MILLLGGTCETATLALTLAAADQCVLVSTATQVPLEIGNHARITSCNGRLDVLAMVQLIQRENVSLLIDATHPYAVEAHATAKSAAAQTAIPHLTYQRPSAVCGLHEAIVVSSHPEAARLACRQQRPVLSTVGSRNIAVYAQEAARAGVLLIARVLDSKESFSDCLKAGLVENAVVKGRGPFDLENNRALIRRFGIGVVVTKDSGEAGGFPAKADAARLESCQLIVVRRPPLQTSNVFDSAAEVVGAALAILKSEIV